VIFKITLNRIGTCFVLYHKANFLIILGKLNIEGYSFSLFPFLNDVKNKVLCGDDVRPNSAI